MTSKRIYEVTPVSAESDKSTEKSRKPLLLNAKSSSPSSEDSPNQELDAQQQRLLKQDLAINESQLDTTIPIQDRYSIVFGIFLLFGIATLLPWNIFINNTDYFTDKLNTTTSRDAVYVGKFTFITGMIGQVTNVIMNLANILISFGGNPKNRIPYTIAVSTLVMIFHVILAMLNSTAWPLTFFIMCCVSVWIMYLATGIMQSCIFYVASILPPEYTNAVILGTNLSGIFTSSMQILSNFSSPDISSAAVIYFLAAAFMLILGIFGFFLMNKNSFFIYYEEKAKENHRSTNENSSNRIPFMIVFKKIWFLLFLIWLNFFSTLSIFPVFQLDIKPNDKNFLYFRERSWFKDFVVFLTFNVCVTIGNLIPKFIQKPGPKYIGIPVISRALLAFMFFSVCNYKPDIERSFPILITNDWVYWLGCGLFPMAFGYFTSLLMMYTPRQVEPRYAGTAGMLASLALVVGVTTGLNFSIVLDKIVMINSVVNGTLTINGTTNGTQVF